MGCNPILAQLSLFPLCSIKTLWCWLCVDADAWRKRKLSFLTGFYDRSVFCHVVAEEWLDAQSVEIDAQEPGNRLHDNHDQVLLRVTIVQDTADSALLLSVT